MSKNDTKKICPLLEIGPLEVDGSCMGDRCAWYIPPEHPGLDPNGYCAMTYLASIAYGVRNT